MPIVFDEIEATVLPDPAPKTPPAGAISTSASAQGDAFDLQSALARMIERADRLRAD